MHTIDIIFKELKIKGILQEIAKKKSIEEKKQRINEELIQLNVSKEDLSFYEPDEQLYLFYKIQKEGINLGLCPEFYIFFSRRNQKFHYLCEKNTKRKRTSCRGRIQKYNFKQK